VTFQDIAPEHTGYFASEVTKWKSGNAIKARHSFSEFRQTIRPDMKWNWMTDVVTELQGFYNAFAAGKRPKLAIGHMEGPAPKKPVKTTGQISANGCTPAGINPPETGCRRDRTAWPMGCAPEDELCMGGLAPRPYVNLSGLARRDGRTMTPAAASTMTVAQLCASSFTNQSIPM
jgi:hypothetical protein